MQIAINTLHTLTPYSSILMMATEATDGRASMAVKEATLTTTAPNIVQVN